MKKTEEELNLIFEENRKILQHILGSDFTIEGKCTSKYFEASIYIDDQLPYNLWERGRKIAVEFLKSFGLDSHIKKGRSEIGRILNSHKDVIYSPSFESLTDRLKHPTAELKKIILENTIFDENLRILQQILGSDYTVEDIRGDEEDGKKTYMEVRLSDKVSYEEKARTETQAERIFDEFGIDHSDGGYVIYVYKFNSLNLDVINSPDFKSATDRLKHATENKTEIEKGILALQNLLNNKKKILKDIVGEYFTIGHDGSDGHGFRVGRKKDFWDIGCKYEWVAWQHVRSLGFYTEDHGVAYIPYSSELLDSEELKKTIYSPGFKTSTDLVKEKIAAKHRENVKRSIVES
jgi:hypothetical protein